MFLIRFLEDKLFSYLSEKVILFDYRKKGLKMSLKMVKSIVFIFSLIIIFTLTSCSDLDTSKSLSSENSDDQFNSITTASTEENLLDLFNDSNKEKKETKLGETAIFDGKDTIFDKFRAKIRLDSIKYGDEATDIVKHADKNNAECLNGFEYIIAEFSIKIEKIYSDSDVCNINPGNFTILNPDFKAYPEVFGIKNVESKAKDLRVGSNVKYKLLFQKNKRDSIVRISFLDRNPSAPLFIFELPNREELETESEENQDLLDLINPATESENSEVSSMNEESQSISETYLETTSSMT